MTICKQCGMEHSYLDTTVQDNWIRTMRWLDVKIKEAKS
jgi:hypothetical protein